MSLWTAANEFPLYLANRSFTVYTDHVSLNYLVHIKESMGRLRIWSILLSQFEINISYKNGKLHTNADVDADAVDDLTPTGIIPTNDDFLDYKSYITELDISVDESIGLSAQFD